MIVGQSTTKVLRAVRDNAGPDGWTPLSRLLDVPMAIVPSGFLELDKAGVRLTKDAETILQFSDTLENRK